jgi:hypothetical protein
MTEINQIQSSTLSAEIRRQMKSGQMKRFIDTLPLFSVDPTTPEIFDKILQRLEKTCPAKR